MKTINKVLPWIVLVMFFVLVVGDPTMLSKTQYVLYQIFMVLAIIYLVYAGIKSVVVEDVQKPDSVVKSAHHIAYIAKAPNGKWACHIYMIKGGLSSQCTGMLTEEQADEWRTKELHILEENYIK